MQISKILMIFFLDTTYTTGYSHHRKKKICNIVEVCKITDALLDIRMYVK